MSNANTNPANKESEPGLSWEKEAEQAAEDFAIGKMGKRHAVEDWVLTPAYNGYEKGFIEGARWAQEKAFLNKQKRENTMNKEAYELMQATLEFYANAGGPEDGNFIVIGKGQDNSGEGGVMLYEVYSDGSTGQLGSLAKEMLKKVKDLEKQ